jgi:hypothetical protein
MITIDLFFSILMLLPPEYRSRPWFVDYVFCASAPLNELLQDFYSFFNQIEYELQFNGQVIYLEHVLNDQFDANERRIYIEDSPLLSSTYLFNKIENNEPTYLFNTSEGEAETYIENSSETQAQYDFVIYIPAGMVYDPELFKYWVNKYRIAPMRWIIEEI